MLDWMSGLMLDWAVSDAEQPTTSLSLAVRPPCFPFAALRAPAEAKESELVSHGVWHWQLAWAKASALAWESDWMPRGVWRQLLVWATE